VSGSLPPPPLSPEQVADSAPFPVVEGDLDRALAVVRFLRSGCPWDQAQTAESLIPYLREEIEETIEAIRSGDPTALRGELGDLLLNLAFQVVVAEEAGHFTAAEVVRGLEVKMIRRHPHLFGLGAPESWGAIKARERGGDGAAGRQPAEGILKDLPLRSDPLSQAHTLQERVSQVGFDWADPRGALAKVREEIDEVEHALTEGTVDALAEEIGDLLFAVVNVARLCRTPAAGALERANAKFRRRFEALEARAQHAGVRLGEASLEALDRLWDEVKAEEKRARSSLNTPPVGSPRSEEAPPDR
jgi:nucleoside triphosphate diphosphatase